VADPNTFVDLPARVAALEREAVELRDLLADAWERLAEFEDQRNGYTVPVSGYHQLASAVRAIGGDHGT